MELDPGTVVLFHVDDAVVFVRAKANELDHVLFDALMKRATRELIAGGTPSLSRDLAKLFVCGWDGVSCGGRPVPYSWQVLESAMGREIVDRLAKFVADNVDILKK